VKAADRKTNTMEEQNRAFDILVLAACALGIITLGLMLAASVDRHDKPSESIQHEPLQDSYEPLKMYTYKDGSTGSLERDFETGQKGKEVK
tara:strand:+ start:668 stop:940 length:273 start_codon:yes stop_codon:yes gene_type:complete